MVGNTFWRLSKALRVDPSQHQHQAPLDAPDGLEHHADLPVANAASRGTAQEGLSPLILETWIREVLRDGAESTNEPQITIKEDLVEISFEASSTLTLRVTTDGKCNIFLGTVPVRDSYASQLPIVTSKEAMVTVMAVFTGMRPCPGFACTNHAVTLHRGEMTRLGVKRQVEDTDKGAVQASLKTSQSKPGIVWSVKCDEIILAGSDTHQCCGECRALQKQLDGYNPPWLRLPKDLGQRVLKSCDVSLYCGPCTVIVTTVSA